LRASAERTADDGVVSQPGPVQLALDEVTHAVGAQSAGDDRVGNSIFDIHINAKIEGGKQAEPARLVFQAQVTDRAGKVGSNPRVSPIVLWR
jgi:hypothetical protein